MLPLRRLANPGVRENSRAFNRNEYGQRSVVEMRLNSRRMEHQVNRSYVEAAVEDARQRSVDDVRRRRRRTFARLSPHVRSVDGEATHREYHLALVRASPIHVTSASG